MFPQDVTTARLRCDPLADTAVAKIVGEWPADGQSDIVRNWQAMAGIGRVLGSKLRNGDLANWQSPASDMRPEAQAELHKFMHTAAQLPDWADRAMITRTSEIFRTHGKASSISLLCASLPEVYAYASITDVLHSSGQLGTQAARRIRSTAGLVLPAMVEGGLTDPQGMGAASILKARLVHACIRNLIMRGNPSKALAQLGTQGNVPALPAPTQSSNPHAPMYARGWDIAENGLPCNQQEQSYVMLCFSHVLLRSLKNFGITINKQDEVAWCHTWNVVGHLVGVERPYMAWNAKEAEEMFSLLQQDGLKPPNGVDHRPEHARSLVNIIARAFPDNSLKHFPELLIRRLCGEQTLQALKLTDPIPRTATAMFNVALAGAKAFATINRRLNLPLSTIEKKTDAMSDRLIGEFLELDIGELRRSIGWKKPGRSANTPNR